MSMLRRLRWRWPSRAERRDRWGRLADLRSDRFAGGEDFHTPVFLPTLIGAVVRNGLSLAQANGCYRVRDQSLFDEKLAHGVPALLGKLHVRFITADIVRMSFDRQMQARMRLDDSG